MAKTSISHALLEELASAEQQNDITRHYWGALMGNSDEIVQQQGDGELGVYTEVMRDDQVFACLQQRILAHLACEWRIEAGGEREIDRACARFIEQQVRQLNFDDVCRKMMLGLFYGFSVGECLWQPEGDKIVLQAIKIRDVQRFAFDHQQRLRLRLPGKSDGKLMPEGKFWLFRSGAEHDDAPYGRGLGYWLYWPVWFKRNFIRFWAQHAERFAAPTLAGRYPAHISAAEKKQLLKILEEMRGRSSIAIPDSMAVEILESTRQVGGDYHAFVIQMDQAISKIILSQTLTTDHGASLAQAGVHMQVKNELIKADADLLCASFNNSVINWLCRWNFPTAKPAYLWRDCAEKLDVQTKITVDQGLYNMGYRPEPSLIAQRYGQGYIDTTQQT